MGAELAAAALHARGAREGRQLRRVLPGRRPPVPRLGCRRQDGQGVGLPDQAVRADDGGAHPQRRYGVLPPRAADHHVGLGGRHVRSATTTSRTPSPTRTSAAGRSRRSRAPTPPSATTRAPSASRWATRTRSRRWTRRGSCSRATTRSPPSSRSSRATRPPTASASCSLKELEGACEIYPQTLMHNSNGRFAVVTGDGEYIIHGARVARSRSATRSTLCGR